MKLCLSLKKFTRFQKDSSLKLVESGTYVEAGTEVVKRLSYTHIDGIVEIKEFNDIIHEVIVRPGELHTNLIQ